MAPGERLEELREKIRSLVENPPPKAIQIVASMRIARLSPEPREVWLVLGEHGDYIVIPGTYCSCPHFTIRIVSQGSTTPCYHLVAVELAKKQGRFIDLSHLLSPRDRVAIVFETIATGRAMTARRLILRLLKTA